LETVIVEQLELDSVYGRVWEEYF